MLVFISDLHITDRRQGVQFLPAEAFRRTLREIALHADEKHARSERVTIVLLGDVFDVVRTSGWFDPPESARPWALPANEEKVEARGLELLDDVIRENQDTFDIWRGSLKEQFGFHEEPERVYIPGNHDRICNQFPSLRKRVSEVLGITHDETQPFDHEYVNLDYRTFARHGHEWDFYNFEGSNCLPTRSYAQIPQDVYLKIPIGELIAAEIASKLSPWIRQELDAVKGLSPAERDHIASQIKTVDDVRPLSSLLPWMLDRFTDAERHGPHVLEAVKRGADRVLKDFQELPFTHQWIKEHDQWYPGDAVDRLQSVLWLMENISMDHLNHLLPQVQKLEHFFQGDNFASQAAQDFQRLDANPDWKGLDPILYVLYGHTHTSDQVPIATLSSNQPRVYLNTGTWRPHTRQGITKKGFMSWKNMTYTMIYHPTEDPGSEAATAGFPTFETWTGSLLEIPTALQARG